MDSYRSRGDAVAREFADREALAVLMGRVGGGAGPARGRAVRVLAGWLERAGREGLPPIAWTVGSVGAQLVGRCDAYRDPARQRADFGRWRAALGAEARPERTGQDGVTRLVAVAEHYD